MIFNLLINYTMFFFFINNFIINSLILILFSLFFNVVTFFFFNKYSRVIFFKYIVFFNLVILYILYIYSLLIYSFFDLSSVPYQFFFWSADANLFKDFLFSYDLSNFLVCSLYLDGISLIFIILLFFLIPVCLIVNLYSGYQVLFLKFKYKLFLNSTELFKFKITDFNLLYCILALMLELILFCFFLTVDLLSFYIFFEASMLPVYFMIGIFGSRMNRIGASYYLFFFTVFGSITFLIGILLIFYLFGSVNLIILSNITINIFFQKFIWLLFFIPLAVKVPIFPFHIWLPEAHVEASTEGSILLAGLLLKLGLFGFLRFLIPIFPYMISFYSPLITAVGLISIIYISCIIFVQVDLKKIIAYSSIIHMNYTLLGLFSNTIMGLQGSIYMMFTHGFISSGLFIIIGFLYIRFNSRIIFYYQGLKISFPFFCTFFFLLILGNFGMPGTGGFIGEFLIFMGLLNKNIFVAVFSLVSPLLGALFSLLLFLRIFYGIDNRSNNLYNFYIEKNFIKTSVVVITSIEFALLCAFVFFVFYTGIYPKLFLNLIEYSSWILIF